MKRIRITELLATIRTNLVAFFSISMFVCLGVGLFLGIRWGAVALRHATDATFDKGSTSDIEVQYPYGITDDDLAQIRRIDGVDEVESGYSCFVVVDEGNGGSTVKFQSITKSANLPTSIRGNMPMESNEVAILSSWAETQGLDIGDTVKLRHDATDHADTDGMAFLTADTFTVTALVDNPSYIAKMPSSYGVSNIGSGSLDGIGFVMDEAFDTSKYQGGYSNVYIRCDGLRGLSSFSEAYKEKSSPIVDALTELGGKLGVARYDDLYGSAKRQITDAEDQINDGEQQLADGKQLLADGEQQLATGKETLSEKEQELMAGKEALADAQVSGSQQLNAAYQKLVEGQAQYDAGLQQFNTARELYVQAAAKFDSVRTTYDALVAVYNTVSAGYNNYSACANAYSAALDAYNADPTPQNWANVESSYAALIAAFNGIVPGYGSLADFLTVVGNAMGLPVSIEPLPTLTPVVTPESAEANRRVANEISRILGTTLGRIAGASITVGGVTITLTNIPAGLQTVSDQLDASKAQLDAAKAQLDSGWAQYNAGKAQYDQQVAAGKQQISSGEQQLEEGKNTIAQKEAELEEGKNTIAQKESELADGKAQLEDAKALLDKMVEYEWVVMPRRDNGGIQGVKMVADMMDNVSWAMASLFIIVGLFVCYSAISRLVHEQIVQIGTKKALGFREGEIAFVYLAFSGLSVLIGIALSVVLGVVLVQGIMNPTAQRQFMMPAYGPYVNALDLLVMAGVEMALILFSTWFAIHGLLKREALDLLRGESTANVKEHFYERMRLWQRMSLYSQTIVNNCVNDKRRVAGTLIGVIGCTALIVTAVTLNRNVARSITSHYEDVYHYDTVAYLTEESVDNAGAVAMELYKRGVTSTPAFVRQMQVRQPDGSRSIGNLVVPTNEDSFEKFYTVTSTTGEKARIQDGGLWVSAAFKDHMGVAVGDELVLTESTGKTHTFTIAGFYDYYLLRQEFVLSPNAYREAFGVKPGPNVLFVNSDGAELDRLRTDLQNVDGYSTLVDEYHNESYAYNEMQEILTTVVLIYLALSAMMALMVLLNLDIMFVDEKKRELIVLMINGFSTKDAKAYIYRDSIVLTIIGMLFGVVLGAIMGAITVAALEPFNGHFVKAFSDIAALVGIVGAGVFATAVLLFALRRIPRFNLTDINRF